MASEEKTVEELEDDLKFFAYGMVHGKSPNDSPDKKPNGDYALGCAINYGIISSELERRKFESGNRPENVFLFELPNY
jgi:hypothetical protein